MSEIIFNLFKEKPTSIPKSIKVLFICKKRKKHCKKEIVEKLAYELAKKDKFKKDSLAYWFMAENQLCLTSSGLLNSARMVVEALNAHGIECKLVDVIDGNCIDKEIRQYKPTHVVLEAFWCPPSKLEELMKIYPKIKWTARNHSKISFLSGEGVAFKWAFDYNNLNNPSYILSSNSQEAIRSFEALQVPCTFTPNVYFENIYEPKPFSTSSEIHIGCFGAIRLLKNNVIQAIAAIKFAEKHNKKLIFHINTARQEMEGGSAVVKSIQSIFENVKDRHTLIEHDWLNHEDFMKVAQRMDLGLQVSYTETFNIVAADFVFAGVPIVVSNEIDWMPTINQADPNSLTSILDTMEILYQKDKKIIQNDCIENIKQYNQNSLNAWLQYLSRPS